MSVSLEKNSETIRDRGKSRYDSPTLRSFQLYPANLRCTDLVLTTIRRPGSPLPLCPFSCWVGVTLAPSPDHPPDATGALTMRPRHSYLPRYRTGERQA